VGLKLPSTLAEGTPKVIPEGITHEVGPQMPAYLARWPGRSPARRGASRKKNRTGMDNPLNLHYLRLAKSALRSQAVAYPLPISAILA
jgi:hypothetical protein